MPTPLSDEAADIIRQLAAPVALNQRQKFLDAVADAISAYPQPGEGLVHRVGREIQRQFTLEAQRETQTLAGATRGIASRAHIRV
jgi:hypothetical protein